MLVWISAVPLKTLFLFSEADGKDMKFCANISLFFLLFFSLKLKIKVYYLCFGLLTIEMVPRISV